MSPFSPGFALPTHGDLGQQAGRSVVPPSAANLQPRQSLHRSDVIRQHFERAFQQTSALLDLVVDGDQLQDSDLRWLRRAQARVERLRPHVRELEHQSV